ncbi:MAG TPA: tetratricopeptide repeat protein [Thermoanaerobaculia bacterium]|nr:tetratricopeptide repeat protein [Thermoanaerobaculia bacterium]
MSGSQRWTEVRPLFEELVDLDASERASRLGALRGSDPDLARRVEGLLAADAEAGGFLEAPAVAVAGGLLDGLDAGVDAPPPERIGPYRVLGRLGRGGMGEVLLAERADGLFDQRVAIKLLRRGMASDDVLSRFSRERRILARLEHPHISRLIDGGATDDGRPYFVMELVEGEPITAWCRARGAPVDERLRLLLDCCDALAAAHRNLVVHRDLKPSNVLVTASGEVKLLDFGIAKLLGPDDTGEAAAETRTELRLLTPAYAAPEQILGEPVTTGTDVWALGALAYELLTGTLPQRRETGSPAKLAAAARDDAIDRPSQRVAREPLEVIPFATPSEAERRRLSRRLRGDLDNILLTALRREPDRRYGSVTALGGDLRRHCEGQPVKARADTLGYRVGKFVRRNRAAVAAAVLVLVSLAGGLAAVEWQARRAEANARAASAAARRAEGVKEFLIGLFEIADPDQTGGQVSAKDILDQAGQRLQTELGREPDVQADLLESVARIDRSLGRLDAAESMAKRSLEIRERALPTGDGSARARSLATLGAVNISKGKLDEADKQLSSALSVLEKAEPPDSLATARARSDYAQVLFWKGQADKAEQLERRVYDTYRRTFGDDHVETAVHLRNLCVLLDELDRLDEAEKTCRDSQAVLVRRLGPEHVNVAQSDLNLAELLNRRGSADEAEKLYQHALEVRRKALGPRHQAVGQSLQLIALFDLNHGKIDESERAYLEALDIWRSIDPKHFEVGKCMNGLALIASRRGRYAEAERMMGEVEALFREVLGVKHSFTWQIRGNRAVQIALQGRFAEAEALQREVVAKIEEINGKDSGEAVDARSRLGETLRKRGRAADALPLHRDSVAALLKIEGEKSAATAAARFQLASDLIAMGRPEDRGEARKLLDLAIGTMEKQAPAPQLLPDARAARESLD